MLCSEIIALHSEIHRCTLWVGRKMFCMLNLGAQKATTEIQSNLCSVV